MMKFYIQFSKNRMYGFFLNMIFLNLYLKKEIMLGDIKNILIKIKSNIKMFTIILLFKFILEMIASIFSNEK